MNFMSQKRDVRFFISPPPIPRGRKAGNMDKHTSSDSEVVLGSPNPYYYGSFLEYGGERDKFNIGDFGKCLKLSAGPNWFIGKDFVAMISYPADDYYWTNQLLIFTNNTTDKWYELRRHVAEITWSIYVDKDLGEFLKSIFGKPIAQDVKEGKMGMKKLVTTLLTLMLSGCGNPYIRKIPAYYNQKTGVITMTYTKHNITNPKTGKLGYRNSYIEFHESEVPCKIGKIKSACEKEIKSLRKIIQLYKDYCREVGIPRQRLKP